MNILKVLKKKLSFKSKIVRKLRLFKLNVSLRLKNFIIRMKHEETDLNEIQLDKSSMYSLDSSHTFVLCNKCDHCFLPPVTDNLGSALQEIKEFETVIHLEKEVVETKKIETILPEIEQRKLLDNMDSGVDLFEKDFLGPQNTSNNSLNTETSFFDNETSTAHKPTLEEQLNVLRETDYPTDVSKMQFVDDSRVRTLSPRSTLQNSCNSASYENEVMDEFPLKLSIMKSPENMEVEIHHPLLGTIILPKSITERYVITKVYGEGSFGLVLQVKKLGKQMKISPAYSKKLFALGKEIEGQLTFALKIWKNDLKDKTKIYRSWDNNEMPLEVMIIQNSTFAHLPSVDFYCCQGDYHFLATYSSGTEWSLSNGLLYHDDNELMEGLNPLFVTKRAPKKYIVSINGVAKNVEYSLPRDLLECLEMQ
jgi:hypothetical protein